MLYYTLRTYERIDLLLPFEEWGSENEAILNFPIAHNTLWLPPKFCINHCL